MRNNDIRVIMTRPSLKVNMEDRLVLKYVTSDHSKLDNLDYEHSGHTGFMPAKVSLLPELSDEVHNDRLQLSVFNEESNEASKISFNDLIDRVIKTDNKVSNNLQKGQYLFLEINKED